MIKVHVVNLANRHLYADLLKDFFRLRHDIFVDEKKWREPHPSGEEHDQFDTPFTTYLIGADENGCIFGSRLLPNSHPNMMSEVFNQFDSSTLRADDVADWTRGFIAPRARGRKIGPNTGLLIGSAMAYCAQEDIRIIGGIQDATWANVWKRYEWEYFELGHAVRIDNRKCFVPYFPVSMEAAMRALPAGYTPENLLVQDGPYRSFVSFGANACARRAS